MVLGGHTNMPCTLRRQTVPARLLSRVGVATDMTWGACTVDDFGPYPQRVRDETMTWSGVAWLRRLWTNKGVGRLWVINHRGSPILT